MRVLSRSGMLLGLLGCFAALTALSAPPRYPAPGKSSFPVAAAGYASLNALEDRRGPERLPAPLQQDTLRTGWGVAEVCLGTGDGLWLGPNSLVWMTLVNPRDLKFELRRGTAVLEVAKLEDRQKVTLSYRGSTVSVLEAGLYGMDAEGAGLSVFKGKALAEVGLRRLEVNAGEMTLLDRAPAKNALGAGAEVTLARWRQWRAWYGEPTLDLPPVPFGGRSMARSGPGPFASSMFGRSSGSTFAGGTRLTPGGYSVREFQSGRPEIAVSGGGPVFINERLVTWEEVPPRQIADRDVIRTTRSRTEMTIGFSSSLWADENSSVRVMSARPSTARFELLEGTAVLEQGAGAFPASFVFRDETIQTLGPGLFRLDATPPALRVFEGSAEVQVGGRKVKVGKGKMLNLDASRTVAAFDRSKADSFGRQPLWGLLHRKPEPPRTFPTDWWPSFGPPSANP